MTPFIVKIQLSYFDSALHQQVLIYNEDKSIMWQDRAGEEIVKTMHGRLKAFFEATRNKDGVIELHREVKDPGW